MAYRFSKYSIYKSNLFFSLHFCHLMFLLATSQYLNSTSLAIWLSLWQKLQIGKRKKKKVPSQYRAFASWGCSPIIDTRTFHAIRNFWLSSLLPVRCRRVQQLGNAAERHRGSSSVHLQISDEYVLVALFTRVFCLSQVLCSAVHCLVFSRRRSTLIEFLFATADKMLTLACSTRCVIDILGEVCAVFLYSCSALYAGGGLRVFVSLERQWGCCVYWIYSVRSANSLLLGAGCYGFIEKQNTSWNVEVKAHESLIKPIYWCYTLFIT